MRKDCREI